MKRIAAVIIDTYEDKLLPKLAIDKTLECNSISKVYTFSDTPFYDGAHFIEIPKIASAKDYEKIVLQDLVRVVNEDLLVIQWDGFVLNPKKWTDDFLNYDYIGAPTFFDEASFIMNGGFSFRSLKLMETFAMFQDSFKGGTESIPEDILISRDHKVDLERLGVKFAPLEVAERFSYQEGLIDNFNNIFGFHSPWNFPLLFEEKSLLQISKKIIERIIGFEILTIFLENCRYKNYFELFSDSINSIEAIPTLVHIIDERLKMDNGIWSQRFINVMKGI